MTPSLSNCFDFIQFRKCYANPVIFASVFLAVSDKQYISVASLSAAVRCSTAKMG